MSEGKKQVQLFKDMPPFYFPVTPSTISDVKKKKKPIRPIETKKKPIIEPPAEVVPEPPSNQTKAFIYIQLQDIGMQDKPERKMSLSLSHEKGVKNLAEEGPSKGPINLDGQTKPSFSMTVEQDNSETLMEIGDAPIIVTLYEKLAAKDVRSYSDSSSIQGITASLSRLKLTTKTDHYLSEDEECEEEEEMVMEPIAIGYIDLLQFFTNQRAREEMTVFLYPTQKEIDLNPGWVTYKTLWHVYTLMPLLKELSFSNTVFITFESIYNASEQLKAEWPNLSAGIYMQSTINRNEDGTYLKRLICDYKHIQEIVISQQSPYYKFEKLIPATPQKLSNMGIRSACVANVQKLFQSVHGTPDIDFCYDEININTETALVCNSMHRICLTKYAVKLLEEAIAFREEEIIIEICKNKQPDEVLLRGTLDPSILLYPDMNACRFAVNFDPFIMKSEQSKNVHFEGKRLSKVFNSRRPSIKLRPTFAIINVCFMQPLTEVHDIISINTTNENVNYCSPLQLFDSKSKRLNNCEQNYKDFDKTIAIFIDYIARNQITAIDQGKTFFCCHLGNLSNTITHLIACDFNIRYPTKTNIEFTNLMTTVYREFMERIYTILCNCKGKPRPPQFSADQEDLSKIIAAMTSIKYMNASGYKDFAEIVLKRMKEKFPDSNELLFYIFIYDVERQNFEAAEEYLKLPLAKKLDSINSYYEIIAIYIAYVKNLSHEEAFNEALGRLLSDLRSHLKRHPKNRHVWILMHCIYANCDYRPGMEFTRWRYERTAWQFPECLPRMPMSLWAIYNDLVPTMKSSKTFSLYTTMRLFVDLGLYRFAKLIYQNITNDCTEAEMFCIEKLFDIFLGEIDTTTNKNARSSTTFRNHINGHLSYQSDSVEKAIQFYGRILDMDNFEGIDAFQLGFLRYSFHMMKEQQYENAYKALTRNPIEGPTSILQNYTIGRALYKVNRLKEAEEHFAKCTTFSFHIPNVWAFLALINLRLGENFKALEFWKYAKLCPDNEIDQEILDELDCIDYKKIQLIVDVPC